MAAGEEKFSATVAEPAAKALEEALNNERMKRLEAEIKVLEEREKVLKALKRAADSHAETETVKRQAIEYKAANHPLPTRYNTSYSAPRTGCAAIYMKKIGVKRVEVSMHVTDMRSVGPKRRTLKSSAHALPFMKDGDKKTILKLYGGTRMLDLRSNYDDAFDVTGCPPVKLTNEAEVWEHLSGLFMDRAKSGFAMGVTWSENNNKPSSTSLSSTACPTRT